MKVRNPELIKATEDFFKTLTKEDVVAVIHHTDPDGVTSGVLAAKLVERIRGKPVDVRYNQEGGEVTILPATVEMLKQKNVTKVVITDLNCDGDAATLKSMSEFANVMVLDHHPVSSTEHAIIYKPQLAYDIEDASGYSAAQIVYDVAAVLVDMEDLDWMCAVGMIGDVATKKWEGFLKKVCEKWKIAPNNEWFETVLGHCAIVISSAEAFDKTKVGECYDVVYNAKGPDDVLNSKLAQYEEIINKEINRVIDEYDEKADKEGEIVFYEIEPKFGIKGTVASLLSKRHKDKMLIVADTRGDKVHISMRTQADIPGNEILAEASEGKGVAGGHRMAAGGTIRKDKWEEFKEAVKRVKHEKGV